MEKKMQTRHYKKKYFKSFRTHTQAKNLKIGRKFELSLKSVVGKVSAFLKLYFLLFLCIYLKIKNT